MDVITCYDELSEGQITQRLIAIMKSNFRMLDDTPNIFYAEEVPEGLYVGFPIEKLKTHNKFCVLQGSNSIVIGII